MATLPALETRAEAASISDDVLALNVSTLIQARAEDGKASNGAGQAVSLDSGAVDSATPDPYFYLRRARFGVRGTYAQDWGFNITFRADGAGRAGTNAGLASASGSAGETALLQQAFVWRTFAAGSVRQQVQIGQDYAFQNREQGVLSSSELLLPNYAATTQLLNSRAPGVGWRLDSAMVTAGADLQNNTTSTGGAAGSLAGENRAEGPFASARIELTLPGTWRLPRDTESCYGRPGHGLRVGADIAENWHARTIVGGAATPNNSQSTRDYGIDALLHLDGLTAVVEDRWDVVTNHADSGPSAPRTNRQVWLAQAGYAVRAAGIALELAARYERIDVKTTTLATDVYGVNNQDDYGNSGRQIDLGFNVYWKGHAVVTQLEYTRWTPSVSGSDAKAQIVRLQQQLAF